jgi:PTH1 family peptidyl-tRNA hydrolase
MYRIIGLGNYGEEYQDTPHNIGKQILELFLKNNSEKFFSSRFDKKRKSKLYSGKIFDEEVELIFFEEFMNNSGDIFNGIFTKENKKEKENIIVIHDDINLPFGKIRISFNRGDGGHNGIKDIEAKIKTKKFIRIRVGVCPLDFCGECRKPESGEPTNKYLVNRQLSRKYTEKYSDYAKIFEDILKEIINNDYKGAMNKFN